ncbi:MAG TPA: abortive infection system antitoxin AbiGi family protein [Pyrinomonadaceae bacterium]|nr:abortive infection system antitoxin AbiGi family protein [Pyrinomonadaceae bacterium]
MRSKFLVHWTGKDLEPLAEAERSEKYAARLKDWYQNGLFARSVNELILRLPKPGQVDKIKMKNLARICFTEIRLSQAESHSGRYGKLGIGFTRDFIANKGGRPVFYNPWEAKSRWVEQNMWLAHERGNDEIKELLDGPLAYFKLMSNADGSEDYYEEMEWRLVHGGIFNDTGTFTAGAEPDTYRVKFEASDVSLIVVPDREVMLRILDDNDMKQVFAAHQPDLILLQDCIHF